MFIFLEVNLKHKLNPTYGETYEPHQPAEGMTEKARQDCSTQARNAHVPAYEVFAEVLARSVGIEEVPAPLVTEICY